MITVKSNAAIERAHASVVCNDYYCYSAGAGRTGTFIAIDYLLEQEKVELDVDIHSCLKQMRDQRSTMIQNFVCILIDIVLFSMYIALHLHEEQANQKCSSHFDSNDVTLSFSSADFSSYDLKPNYVLWFGVGSFKIMHIHARSVKLENNE